MRPLDALAHTSRALHALTGSGLLLTVCEDCRDALLADLARLFSPLPPDQARLTLAGSCIMGCTFSEGPAEVCMLHRLLHEDDACTFALDSVRGLCVPSRACGKSVEI